MSLNKKVLRAPGPAPKAKINYWSVASTTTTTNLAPENPRRELIVANTSSANLYLGIGRRPSATNYTVCLSPGATFITASTNAIFGVWANAGGGQANITEEV